MSKKLYVGNLPFTVTEKDLYTIFCDVGPVEVARLMTDEITGKSRGFAFVEMDTEADALRAVAELHGALLNERPLIVNLAKTSERRAFREGRPARW